MSRNAKIQKAPKVFLQNNISSSHCSGPELYYFLNCKYEGVEPEYIIPEATAVEVMEESFRFIFPEGVPEYYKSFSSRDITWKKITSMMFEEFSQNEIIDWQLKNHTFNYTNATSETLKKQELMLRKAYRQSCQSKCQKSINTGIVMLELHSLLALLQADNTKSDNKDKGKRYEDVKGNLYNIFNLLDLHCRGNDHAKFTFQHPKGRRLQNEWTCFSAKPDGSLYVIEAGEKPLTSTAEVPYYPYLVMQVHGPDSNEVITSLSSESSTPNVDSDSDSDDSDESLVDDVVTRKIERISVHQKKTAKQSVKIIEKGRNYYNDEYRSTRKSYKRIIANESPIYQIKEMKVALRQSTGQLPIEMYGSLLYKMYQKICFNDLATDEESQTVGMFVVNERVYLQRIVENNNVAKVISQSHIYSQSDRSNIPQEGPKIYLARWYFDLNIANHRIAFQAMLFYLQEITHYELNNFQ